MKTRLSTVIAIGLVLAFAVAVGPALAKKGDHTAGTSGGGATGGAPAQVATFNIATQQRGSITFGVSVANAGTYSLIVTNRCYGSMSELVSSADLPVVWDSGTVGHTAAFAPASGLACFAFVHDQGSDSPLADGRLSYMSM
jgi:hypothetical protein